MKKYLIVIAAAAMLAGCAKTEVIAPDGNAPAEITFTTAPITKGLAEGQSKFSTSNIFSTYACYTADGFDYTDGEAFISWETVSHNDGDDSWKTATSYFWPKDGGCLSFFSWSLNTASLDFSEGNPTVSFDPKSGITLDDYSCTGNDDFMVADPALSMTGNVKTYERHGVPTLFRHKTAQVKFFVQTKKAYDKTFTLTGISFTGVSTTGTYVQGNNLTGTGAVAEGWTPTSSTAMTSCYSDASGMTFDVDGKDVPSNKGTYIFVPQTFSNGDGKTLNVTYKMGDTEKTATIPVNSMLGGDADTPTAFQMGKIYTITLVFSGSEILWNPKEVDWDGETRDVTVG